MGIGVLWGVDGAISEGPPQFAYDTLYAYDGGGLLIYIGWALSSPTPGPVEGLPAITSLVPSTGPATSGAYWADGNTRMDNIWDNRATTVAYQ